MKQVVTCHEIVILLDNILDNSTGMEILIVAKEIQFKFDLKIT